MEFDTGAAAPDARDPMPSQHVGPSGRRPPRSLAGAVSGGERSAHAESTSDGEAVGEAHLSVVIIEGQGIWLALAGPLTEGCCAQVTPRFERLGRLGFLVVVLDVRGVAATDEVGLATLADFGHLTRAGGGRVRVIDTTRVLAAMAAPPGWHTTASEPEGAWWVRDDAAARAIPDLPATIGATGTASGAFVR